MPEEKHLSSSWPGWHQVLALLVSYSKTFLTLVSPQPFLDPLISAAQVNVTNTPTLQAEG